MIRLKIILFVGFTSLNFINESNQYNLLCGNIATELYTLICNCGENSFELNFDNEFVCISDGNCQLEPEGM